MSRSFRRQTSWLGVVGRWVPGLGGYLERARGRSENQALRDAAADRLGTLRFVIEAEIRLALDRGDSQRINSLDCVLRRLDRVTDRLRSVGAGNDSFHRADGFDGPDVDSLRRFDVDVLQHVEQTVADFQGMSDAPDVSERLSMIVVEIEHALQVREAGLRGVA